MSRLDSLFEEDVQMQDSLEDIETLVGDSEDILLLATNDRYNEIEESQVHLFTNEGNYEVNDDGLTPDEELEIDAELLAKTTDEELAYDDDDDLLDDLV